jgi:hypothetical protein
MATTLRDALDDDDADDDADDDDSDAKERECNCNWSGYGDGGDDDDDDDDDDGLQRLVARGTARKDLLRMQIMVGAGNRVSDRLYHFALEYALTIHNSQ